MISILDTLSLLWPYSSQEVVYPRVRQPVPWAEVWHRGPVFVEIGGVLHMPYRKLINTEFVVGRGDVVRAYLPIDPPTSVGSYGEPLTQADVDEVLLTVTSDGEPVAGYNEQTQFVQNVILDELQGVGDPRVTGANLVVDIPGDAFPDADTMATVVIVVNGTDSAKSWVVEARGRVRAAGSN